jgi:DNA polymerase-3 subunit beta
MVATDGHRLAFIEKKIETDASAEKGSGDDAEAKPAPSFDTLIPRKALLELRSISRETDGDISYGEDDRHLFFQTEGRLLITRKLSGTFPNYEMVMPKSLQHSAVFRLDEMRDAVRRVSLMSDERMQSIKLTVRKGEIELFANSAEEGEAREVVPAEYDGEEITIGFNWHYLLDYLGNAGAISGLFANSQSSEDEKGEKEVSASGEGDSAAAGVARAKSTGAVTRISFEFNDANGPSQMRLVGDTQYDYRYIVMPLRI